MKENHGNAKFVKKTNCITILLQNHKGIYLLLNIEYAVIKLYYDRPKKNITYF